jgi:two-component system KDP operon response regulator KdpE
VTGHSDDRRQTGRVPAKTATQAVIIDDDARTRIVLQKHLSLQGFDVTDLSRLDEGLEALHEKIELIIVSADLPGVSGGALVDQVRGRSPHAAVILISCRHDEADIAAALDHGANAYVIKPFAMGEFLARVRTALRHRLRQKAEKASFQAGALTVDDVHRHVMIDGKKLHLTPKEYELLHLLVQHAGSVVSNSAIMKRLWTEETSQSYLRVLIRAVRQKIERDPSDPNYILTVTGVGYRLRTPG